MNPANTLWSKHYNLYSKIDTEAPRYLEFERWWGGHVYLNAEEIQFIVDQLFVGNNLAAGRVHTSDGTGIDLRNIRSPIVVFCSKGDNITPPQQALGWILDLYSDTDEIRANGQTIVYTVHESAGHLGIFVSGSVAKKEHAEFASNIDLIDLLPPGLYEATFTPKAECTVHPDLVIGDWVMRCEQRTLNDIRALGGREPGNDRMFAAAAQVSAVNLALYRTFVQPLVRAAVNPAMAEAVRKLHPLRLQYEILSDVSPIAGPLAALAEQVRENRQPAGAGNPFLAAQEAVSKQIVSALEVLGKIHDRVAEDMFFSIYGSPAVQAVAGIRFLFRSPAARGTEVFPAAGADPRADRPAQIAAQRGRPLGMCHSRAALCGSAARGSGRTRSQCASQNAPFRTSTEFDARPV